MRHFIPNKNAAPAIELCKECAFINKAGNVLYFSALIVIKKILRTNACSL